MRECSAVGRTFLMIVAVPMALPLVIGWIA